MILNLVALAFVAVVCIIVPLIVLGILLYKGKKQRKGIVIAFISGTLIYVVIQWGIKEQGLVWLLNNTGFMDFMNHHYIPYLLVVAVAGAVLAVLAQMLVIVVPFKKNISFIKAISFGLGYGMMESVLLIGAGSINTMVYLLKDTEMQLSATYVEWFLSGYERILIMIIETAIVVAMIYFVEHEMTVQGGVIATICYTLVAFLPGFFIAFSLKDYYELYDRQIALLLVYIVLTAMAITSLVVINALKYQLKDGSNLRI